MPAFIPVLDTLKADVMLLSYGQECHYILNFKYNAPPGATERSNLATALHTWWTNQLKPAIHQTTALARVTVTDLNSASSPSTTVVISPVEPGLYTSASSLSSGSALVCTHRTALRGRNYRGRTYVVGIPVDLATVLTNADTVQTGYISNITGAFAWLMNAVNTASGIWSVVSKFVGNAPRANGITTPITAVSADQFIDSQRRRLIGRGT